MTAYSREKFQGGNSGRTMREQRETAEEQKRRAGEQGDVCENKNNALPPPRNLSKTL